MKTRVRKAVVLVNSFGAAGYLFSALAWIMFGMAALWLAMQSSVTTLPVDITSQSAPSTVITDKDVVMRVVAYSIAVVTVIIIAAFVIALPYLVGKWGSRIVRRLMRLLRIKPGLRHTFLTKSLLTIVPLIGFAGIAIWLEPVEVALPLLHIASIVMSVFALGCFILQIWAARTLSVLAKDVW